MKQAFKKIGIKAQLAVKFIDNNKRETSQLPHDISVEADLLEEVQKYNFNNSKIILDNYHQSNVKNSDYLKYLINLKKHGNEISLIEGLATESCPSEYYEYIDTLITPYVTEYLSRNNRNINRLFGKNYLLLDDERIAQNKKIRAAARNILVTFGGSDPHSQTLHLLKALLKDEHSQNLNMKIVIGSLMSEEDKEKIQQILTLSQHQNISVERGLNHLKTCFEWADLAITNTGQTRYELAASGVPFIVYPFDQVGYEVSIIFEKLGAAILENFPVDFSIQELSETIFELLGNYEKRLSMSENGIKHFSVPNGPTNLAKILWELSNEANQY
ncbi:MAG: hypothetical protein ACOH2E_01480 [Candidatus Paracaedibacter sp.]